MRPLLRALPWVAGLLVVLQLLFFGLLLAGAAVPDRAIVDDLAADVRAGTFGENGEPDRVGGRSTAYTDCVAAGTGLGRPDWSVLERAVRMPRLESCRGGAEGVLRLARGGVVDEPPPYFRYWAGYTVLTRPVLAEAGMDGLRMVAGGLFGLSLLVMVMTVARRTGNGYAVALVAPLLLSTNVLTVPSTGASHALSLAVAFGGVALTAWATRFSERVLLCAVAASAAVFNFVDLLTTPAIPWAMTAAVVAAATLVRTSDVRRTFWTALAAGVVWPVAFAVTWVSRWAITALFLGWGPVMDTVLGIARFRVSGEHEKVSDAFGAAIGHNWATWMQVPVTPGPVLFAAAAVAGVCLVLGWRAGGAAVLPRVAVVAAPALVIPAWLVVMSNHSQIHDHFVYRTVPAAVGVVLAACVLARSRRPGRRGRRAPTTARSSRPGRRPGRTSGRPRVPSSG